MRSFVVVAAFGVSCAVAQAGFFLNGALAYNSDSSGANVGGPFEYDTFGNTGNSQMQINGLGPNISIALSLGENDFTWSNAVSGSGLGLYLGSVSAPVTNAFGLAPNLVIGAGGFAPLAGVMVPTFGQFSPEAPYSGAVSLVDGDLEVIITGYSFNSFDGGTFQLTVREIPSPASSMIMGALGLTWLRRRR